MPAHLEAAISGLEEKLLSLTALVDSLVSKAIDALEKKDVMLAKEVIAFDDLIDQKEVEIEEECLKILALHQPVAVDLRYIVGVLKMNNDLERIGDLAVNIAERVFYLNQAGFIEPPFDFVKMGRKTLAMGRKTVNALINRDTTLARQVCQDDEIVDNMNKQMYEVVFAAIKKNPEHVESLMQYLSTSRHLERIADYITNIAEDIIYMVEGKIVRHRPELYEEIK